MKFYCVSYKAPIMLKTLVCHYSEQHRAAMSNHQNLCSLCGKTTDRKISQNLEAVRLDDVLILSFFKFDRRLYITATETAVRF